jgi:hypothetical protein
MRAFQSPGRRCFGPLKLVLGVSVLIGLSACGGDNSQVAASSSTSTPLSASPPPQTPAVPSGSIQITVSPALIPSFDPSIHDYVIHCASEPEVVFSGQLHGGTGGFFGPGDTSARPEKLPGGYLLQTIGSFQKVFTLKPGQRFRFLLDQEATDYSVRCLPADFPPLSVATNGTRQAEYYLFAPTLAFYLPPSIQPSTYVIITDSNGTPVWWKSENKGAALDAKILGSDMITWTVQTGINNRVYVIRSFAGDILDTLGPNLNEHELQLTPAGTYLAIRDVQRICPPDCADMSPWGGPAQMGPLDQEIVEIDRNSNVLWIWRTRDHITLAESGGGGFFPGAGPDIIHMNAVEYDGPDAILFSARNLSSIYRVIKSTGAIDWKVGGTPRAESLVVMGDTRPTTMGANGIALSGQHDVRRWEDGTVSVHDNGTAANRPPSVVRFQIDTAARTALVVEQHQDAIDGGSLCCGSARRLPGGHWLVQWGGIPYMTELDSNGNSVFTITYNVSNQFSYRAVPVLPGIVARDELRDGMDAMSAN